MSLMTPEIREQIYNDHLAKAKAEIENPTPVSQATMEQRKAAREGKYRGLMVDPKQNYEYRNTGQQRFRSLHGHGFVD